MSNIIYDPLNPPNQNLISNPWQQQWADPNKNKPYTPELNQFDIFQPYGGMGQQGVRPGMQKPVLGTGKGNQPMPPPQFGTGKGKGPMLPPQFGTGVQQPKPIPQDITGPNIDILSLTGDKPEKEDTTGVENKYYKESMDFMLSLMHGESPLAKLISQREKQELSAEQAASRQKLQQSMAQKGMSPEQAALFAGMQERQQEAARVELGGELAEKQLMQAQNVAGTLAQMGLAEEQFELEEEKFEFQKKLQEDIQKDNDWKEVLQNYDPTNPQDLETMKKMWNEIYPDRPTPSFSDFIEQGWEGKAEKAGASLAAYIQENKGAFIDPDTGAYNWQDDPILMNRLSEFWKAETQGEEFDINNPIHKDWADRTVKQMSMTMGQKEFQESVNSIHQSDWYNQLTQDKKTEIDKALIALEQLNLLGGFTVKTLDDGTVAFFQGGEQIWPDPNIPTGTVTDIVIDGVEMQYSIQDDGTINFTHGDGSVDTYKYNHDTGEWFLGDNKVDNKDILKVLNANKPTKPEIPEGVNEGDYFEEDGKLYQNVGGKKEEVEPDVDPFAGDNNRILEKYYNNDKKFEDQLDVVQDILNSQYDALKSGEKDFIEYFTGKDKSDPLYQKLLNDNTTKDSDDMYVDRIGSGSTRRWIVKNMPSIGGYMKIGGRVLQLKSKRTKNSGANDYKEYTLVDVLTGKTYVMKTRTSGNQTPLRDLFNWANDLGE